MIDPTGSQPLPRLQTTSKAYHSISPGLLRGISVQLRCLSNRRRDILVTPAGGVEHSAFLGDLNRQVRRPNPDTCCHRDSENRIANLV